MPQDTAHSAELRRKIAAQMNTSLGLERANLVQDALENALDIFDAQIVDKPKDDCCDEHHHSGRKAG